MGCQTSVIKIQFGIGQLHAVNNQFSLIDGFKFVDGPYQGGFSRTGRAADHHDFTLLDMEIDIIQDM